MNTKTIAILIGVASILGCFVITTRSINKMRTQEFIEWCLNEGI